MDSITHIALGAIIGEAAGGKSLGKQAMLFGAIAQSFPDIDFIGSFWLKPANDLLAHRGFTHSILFALGASFLAALIFDKWYKNRNFRVTHWFLFFSMEMLVHLFVDVMNVYGVGLFEPFSHQRFSLNTLFVADPLFSIWAGISFAALLILRSTHPARKNWTRFGIIVPVIYLVLAVSVKIRIDHRTRNQLAEKQISTSRYFTTPTALNILLWYTVAEQGDGYYIGYQSVFDERPLDLKFNARNDEQANSIHDHEELELLKRFSEGYYVITNRNDTLIFNDMRFGQVFGWNNPDAEFVFQYNLSHADANVLVIQRGRFSNWTKDNLRETFKRMSGD